MESETAHAPLDAAQLAFLAAARTATLATISPTGRPRLVPVCFVVEAADSSTVLYTPIDEKPKRAARPAELARVRDILARPEVAVLVDRWSEDWSELAWLRLDGTAAVLEPADADSDSAAAERGPVIAALRAKYPQYRDHDLESRPIIRIVVQRAVGWGDVDP
jgi:PPOX class probable F420-dependent enzyme